MQTNKRVMILEENKKKVLAELKECGNIITGSLVYLKRRCGTDKKYGAYFLSDREKGRTHLIYVPKKKVNQIREKIQKS